MDEPKSRHLGALASALQRVAAERPRQTAQHLLSIHAQIEAIERGDVESVLQHAHDDVTFEIFAPPQFPFISSAHGLEELRAAVTHNFAAVVDQQPELRDIFAEGDTVILFGRERGRLRERGDRYDVEFVQRFAFRDGRLASVRIVVAEAARQ
jgi:ketosteroid isomerase-like protein